MAVLTSAYREDEQNGEKRIYLALPENLAPVKYAVSPLLKNKPELVEKARGSLQSAKEKIWKRHVGRQRQYRQTLSPRRNRHTALCGGGASKYARRWYSWAHS